MRKPSQPQRAKRLSPALLSALLLLPPACAAESPLFTSRPFPDPLAKDVTVEVRCKHTFKSGKRLQSYWFTLAVVRVLEGRVPQRTITLTELDDDRGGRQLALRWHTSGPYMGRARCRGRATLKLRRYRDQYKFAELVK